MNCNLLRQLLGDIYYRRTKLTDRRVSINLPEHMFESLKNDIQREISEISGTEDTYTLGPKFYDFTEDKIEAKDKSLTIYLSETFSMYEETGLYVAGVDPYRSAQDETGPVSVEVYKAIKPNLIIDEIGLYQTPELTKTSEPQDTIPEGLRMVVYTGPGLNFPEPEVSIEEIINGWIVVNEIDTTKISDGVNTFGDLYELLDAHKIPYKKC